MPKLNLSDNALQILKKRYLTKNADGKVIEKPEDLFKRVANNIALTDAKYLLKEEINNLENTYGQEYFEIVKTKEFRRILNKNKKVKARIEKTSDRVIIRFLPKISERNPEGKLVKLVTNCRIVVIRPNIMIETPKLSVT